MSGIISSLVVIGVVLFAAINAKIFNAIHGVFSFFGSAITLEFIYFVSNDSFKEGYFKIIDSVDKYIIGFLTNAYSTFHLNFLADSNKWVFYIVGIGLWIISFIISFSIASGKRKRRESR